MDYCILDSRLLWKMYFKERQVLEQEKTFNLKLLLITLEEKAE